ncbi:hypothetical protein ACFL18_01800 [Patescibacteria group bacterium]
MSSVILTNWTVYYADDIGAGKGMKQIKWTGTTGTNTVNELYSALADLFSIPAQNNADDTIPMRAITPTLYEIGAFDTGDLEPWFIDPESIKHLTGSGLNTVKWKRDPYPGDGTGDIGIVKIQCSSTAFGLVAGDIGDACTDDVTSDSGVILHVDTTNYIVWVRPDDNTSANDFNTGSGTISADTSSNVATQTGSSTGENVWSNIYTLGSIEDNTTIYITQSNANITNTEDSGSGRWWGDGHPDVLILTTDTGTLTDRGLLTIYARQYSKKYGFYTSDASAGGRIPVPLATSDDLNNTSGYRQSAITENAAFVVGEEATGAVTGARAIVTAYTSSVLTYYLIGDLTEFNDSENITGSASGDVDATGAPANVSGGPATAMSITFGLDTTFDINADTTNEDYSIVINLTDSITLAQMNERIKYKTRRGETTTLDGLEGQQYIGIDYRVDYTTISGTIADGSTVTQVLADGTTATSEVVAHSTADDYMMLRDTRGTLETGGTSAWLGIDAGNSITMSSGATVTTIAPVQEHPFGNFAGGRFFGARGVVLDNVPAADSQNYELIDNDGTRIVPPVTIPITVNAVVAGDRVTMFRATGDNNIVDKTIFTSHATSNTAGNAAFITTVTIDTDHGDSPTSGKIRVVNNSGDGLEQRYRYASWATTTFTFVTGATGSDTAGTGTAILEDSAADFGGADDVEVGDVIRNTSTGESGKVTEIISTTELRTSGLDSGWTSGNTYTHNVLDRTYDGTDTAYVPFLDEEAVSTSVSENVTYEANRYVTTRVRKLGIIPFTVKGEIDSSGITVTAIRNPDDIVNLPG